MNDKKLFVFLRHNNDIDHITPVLYKWLKTQDIPVGVFVTTHRYFLDDYRMKLLEGLGDIKIRFITDSFSRSSLASFYMYFYKKYYAPMDRYTDNYEFVYNRVNKTIKCIADEVFDGVSNGVVVFDWVVNHFTRRMLSHAKDRGFVTVSLPHGDAPYINRIETIDQLNYDHCKRYGELNIFDYVVVPNWIVERRYKEHVSNGKVKVLGSPRYCDEWMKLLDRFVPVYSNGKDDFFKFRVVLFLRNIEYPIYWEEVARVIKMVLQFPDVSVVVKQHARSNRDVVKYRLFNSYPGLKKFIPNRLQFVYGDCNPSSLIRWCDVVLDLGTSMTWEPVKMGKPVLCLDFVHSNLSTVGHYMAGCRMDCRDKFFETFTHIYEDGYKDFYNPVEQKNFIKNVIDVPDEEVLERYCDFLRGICT